MIEKRLLAEHCYGMLTLFAEAYQRFEKDYFPDMILGDNDERTADMKLISTAMESLSSGGFQVNHNTPFKGGHITRYFGKPDQSIHALQLEMNKILYMDDSETKFNEERANKMRAILKPTFVKLN